MRTITLMILFLAAAGPARQALANDGAPTAQPPATRADPPAESDGTAGQWTPTLRDSVMLQCQKSVPDRSICPCFARQLEALSRDSEVVTSENMQTAMQRCRDM